jgi:hypothetical protein
MTDGPWRLSNKITIYGWSTSHPVHQFPVFLFRRQSPGFIREQRDEAFPFAVRLPPVGRADVAVVVLVRGVRVIVQPPSDPFHIAVRVLRIHGQARGELPGGLRANLVAKLPLAELAPRMQPW